MTYIIWLYTCVDIIMVIDCHIYYIFSVQNVFMELNGLCARFQSKSCIIGNNNNNIIIVELQNATVSKCDFQMYYYGLSYRRETSRIKPFLSAGPYSLASVDALVGLNIIYIFLVYLQTTLHS